MKRVILAMAVALFLVAADVRSQDGPTTRPSAIAAVVPFLGEWHIEATWAGGAPLKARATYEWGLNRKYVNVKTFVSKPDGGEYQRYESIWADVDGKLVLYSFTFDGHSDVRDTDVQGAKFKMQWKAADGVQIRQTTELVDPTHMTWHVEVLGQDRNWQTVMDGVWVKAA